jgi:hypothetical protein
MQGGDAAYAFVYFDDHEAAARAKKYIVDSFPTLKVGFYMKNSLFEINAVPTSFFGVTKRKGARKGKEREKGKKGARKGKERKKRKGKGKRVVKLISLFR